MPTPVAALITRLATLPNVLFISVVATSISVSVSVVAVVLVAAVSTSISVSVIPMDATGGECTFPEFDCPIVNSREPLHVIQQGPGAGTSTLAGA